MGGSNDTMQGWGWSSTETPQDDADFRHPFPYHELEDPDAYRKNLDANRKNVRERLAPLREKWGKIEL